MYEVACAEAAWGEAAGMMDPGLVLPVAGWRSRAAVAGELAWPLLEWPDLDPILEPRREPAADESETEVWR
ncbi:MAG: hypothetical protein U0821_26915 [Chloroflexota bacterium]